ncbi:MAG: hypothetical protein ABI472_21025 [Ginsengibacter sp.]
MAKTIVNSMGMSGNAATEKLLEQFLSENKRRGKVPWEMLADLWASLGNYYQPEN